MPTGYTAKLCEGEQSFGEFALGCARAFGACVMQREDSMDDLPKAREHDGDVGYYSRALETARRKAAIDYYNEEVASAKWKIDYHKKENEKSNERVVDQNKWIEDLYASLGAVDPEVSVLLLKKV